MLIIARVGFLIKKTQSNIESFIGVSKRIYVLNLDTISLSIVQAYAPTSDYSDIDMFYNKLKEIKKKLLQKHHLNGRF